MRDRGEKLYMLCCPRLQLRALCLLLVTLIALAVSIPAGAAAQRRNSRGAAALSPAQAERTIAARARAVVEALRRRDVNALARFAHPTRGVRFSPQPGVLPSDVILRRGELVRAWRANRPNVWGETEAGEISLNFRQYWGEYIYSHDFARDGAVSYNRPRAQGNNVNTLRENYPRALIVGFHHPGHDPARDGMNWGILWLMFERAGNEWFLVGIANNQWAM